MTERVSPRVAVVGVAGKWSTECLADALEKRTGFRLVVDATRTTLDLKSGSLWYAGQNLCELDGMVIKKVSSTYSTDTIERLELLRFAEASGVRCFGPIPAMQTLVDRLRCTLALHTGGIPLPETTITEQLEQAITAVNQYGEAILKPLFSSKARGMRVLSADMGTTELIQQIADFKADNPVLYVQKKYDLAGEDYGLVFLGDRYLCAYARKGAKDAWNTTINSGGHYSAYHPPEDIIALADKARSLFGLDYTTVDIAITSEGPCVFEVSAFGGFRGVKTGAGLDAAELYAAYILNKLGDSA